MSFRMGMASIVVVISGLLGIACSSDDASDDVSQGENGGRGGSPADAGDSESEAGPGVGGSTGGSGGSSSGSGGQAGQAGVGGANGGSAGTDGSKSFQYGYVSVMQTVMTVGGNEYASYSFSAGFTRSSMDSGAASCEVRDEGPCRISDCTTQPADGGTSPYETVSAGVITLSGASKPLSLVPDSSGSYAVLSGQEKLWSGGATLSISAAGDGVPGFQTTLHGAMPAVVNAPSFPSAGSPISLSTKSPLTISWSGAMGGTMTAMLARTITAGDTRTVVVSCTFSGQAGTGTVPSSAMAAIPPGPDGVFQVIGGDTILIDKAGWTVNVQEYVPATTPDGSVTSVIATYL